MEDRVLLAATVYTVNAITDTGAGSGTAGDLLYCVNQANSNSNTDGSLIQFDPTVFGTPQTITLSNTLTLSETAGPEVINGPGASLVTVSGNNAVEVFSVDSGVTAALTGLTVSGGSTGGDGGGIGNNGTTTISYCTVDYNSGACGGGIHNAGTLTITYSTIAHNSGAAGGGIYNAGTLTVTYAALYSNSGNPGGGVYNSGTLTLTNSTIAYNYSGSGGGIANVLGQLAGANDTIAYNAGCSLFTDDSPTLDNTIVDSVIEQGYVVFPTGSAHDLVGTDSGLGTLTYNGGATPTIPLLTGSPAIDAGSNALAVDPTTSQPLAYDQRGPGFPRIVNGTVDIGAFEFDSGGIAVVTTQPPGSVTAGSGFGFTVTVEDKSGNAIGRFDGTVTVALSNNPGEADQGGTLSVTAHDGVATFSGLTLDKAGNSYTLLVSVAGLAGVTTSPFDVTAAAATQLVVTTQPPSSITAGTEFGLVVSPEDAFGNVDPTFNGGVAVALLNNPGGATLGGTLTATAQDGVATFSGLTLDKAGNGYTLEVSSDRLADVTTGTLNVTHAAATQLVVTTQPPRSVLVGFEFGLVVSAEDPFGNVDPTFSGVAAVGLSNNAAGATVGGTLTVVAQSGVATFSDLTLDRARMGYTLEISGGGLAAATTDPFDVTPARLVVTTQPPGVVTVGLGFGLTVTAEDNSGNVDSLFDGTATVGLATNQGRAALGGTLSVAIQSGVATFSGLTLNRVGTGYILRVSGNNLTAAPTAGFDVQTNTAPTHYTVDLTSDTGAGSGREGDLRYVIDEADANTNPLGSVIRFDPTVFASPQTITLSSTLVLSETAGPEVIDGPGASLVTVSGNNAVEVFSVASGVTATLTGLTIANGLAAQGGGIAVDGGTVSLTNVTVTGNQAVGSAGMAGAAGGSGLGGGIYLGSGSLVLNGDIINGNVARGGAGGNGGSGGHGGSGGSAAGGGIYAAQGTLVLKNDVVGSNQAIGGAGGNGGNAGPGGAGGFGGARGGPGGNGGAGGSGGVGQGGALYIASGNLTIRTSSIETNIASGGPGGVGGQGGDGGQGGRGYHGYTGGHGRSTGPEPGGLGGSGEVGGDGGSGGQGGRGGAGGSGAGGGLYVAGGNINLLTDDLNSDSARGGQAGAGGQGGRGGTGGLGGTGGYGGVGGNARPGYIGHPRKGGIGGTGGRGGRGGNGGDGGKGNNGGTGGAANGGALYVGHGAVDLNSDTLNADSAIGGHGGDGGSGGSGYTGGKGGTGGRGGGGGQGGAGVRNSPYGVDWPAGTGGTGGDGGRAGSGGNGGGGATGGTGGNGGDANGGGLYVSSGSVTFADDTLSGNSALGGAGAVGGVAGHAGAGGEWGTVGYGGPGGRGGSYLSSGLGHGVTGYGPSGVAGQRGQFGYVHGSTGASGASGPAGSSALAYGAGLYVAGGSLSLVNSTAAYNNLAGGGTGGGLDIAAGATATLDNAIVALNTSGSGAPASDIAGTISVASAHNLIGTGGSGGLVNGVNGNQVGVADPVLGPLADNGGPTQTIALLPGSPAIGAGSETIPGVTVPTTDQRGVARPRNSVDIGAFQDRGFTLAVVVGSSPQRTTIDTPFRNALAVAVTSRYGDPVAGGVITFIVSPAENGASATLSASDATIGADGQASVTATANGITGTYGVTATAAGAARPTLFRLRNVAPRPHNATAVAGGSTQTAAIQTAPLGLTLPPPDPGTDPAWRGVQQARVTLGQRNKLVAGLLSVSNSIGVSYVPVTAPIHIGTGIQSSQNNTQASRATGEQPACRAEIQLALRGRGWRLGQGTNSKFVSQLKLEQR
jgi:hypothetical protein